MARGMQHSREDPVMAAKVRMLKLLQEMRGYAEVANRLPPPRSAGPLLAEMRPPIIQAALPRRRLSVAMVERDAASIPNRVRINHVNPGPSPATLPQAP